MGGVVSQLCVILCQHKCSAASVASSLTFFPPDPPLYELREGLDGRRIMVLDPLIPDHPCGGLRIVTLRTRRGSLINGFLFLQPGAKYTIIFSHGNAADCGVMRERYMQLRACLDCNVLGYDYTGYGGSQGVPSEAHTYSDLEAAYDYLVAEGVCSNPAEQIILFGQSVGSGPSVKLASTKKRPVRGLILHSPIMSGLRVLTMSRGPLACCDIYPNISRIRRVRAPVLVIHGDADDQVHFEHGARLHDAVPEQFQTAPCWVRGGGHNDIVERFPDQFFGALRGYVKSLAQADEPFFKVEVGDGARNGPGPSFVSDEGGVQREMSSPVR